MGANDHFALFVCCSQNAPNAVAPAIRHNPDAGIYANTCSQPRLDGFGGGAHVLDLATGKTIAWTYTDGWLAEMLDETGDAS